MQSIVMDANNESLISAEEKKRKLLLDLALSKYSRSDECNQWQGVLPSPELSLNLVGHASCVCTITVVSMIYSSTES